MKSREEINKEARERYHRSITGMTVEQKNHRKETLRHRDMSRNHKMTQDEYNLLLDSQGGVCAICRKPPLGTPLGVDHNHRCCNGSRSCRLCNRGLLCYGCNFLIGLAKDNVEFLRNMIEYLDKYENQR